MTHIETHHTTEREHKALRDNTGKDCAKAGGWFAALAKRVKPNEKVGSVLSEAQLQKLCGGNKPVGRRA